MRYQIRSSSVANRIGYRHKKVSNPYFRNKRGRFKALTTLKKFPMGSWRFKLILVIIGIAIVAVAWLAVFSPWVKITKIDINIKTPENAAPVELRLNSEQIKNVVQIQMNQKKWLVLPEENIFLFSSDKLETVIKKNFYIDSLNINKRFPNQLKIDIAESEYALLWEEDGNYYFLDNAGNVVAKATSTDNAGQTVYVKNFDAPKIVNAKHLDMPSLPVIFQIAKSLRQRMPDIGWEYFSVDEKVNSIKVKLQKGPLIIFSTDQGTEDDINRQINKLKIVIDEKLKDALTTKQYIDLRYGDKVIIN